MNIGILWFIQALVGCLGLGLWIGGRDARRLANEERSLVGYALVAADALIALGRVLS